MLSMIFESLNIKKFERKGMSAREKISHKINGVCLIALTIKALNRRTECGLLYFYKKKFKIVSYHAKQFQKVVEELERKKEY